MKNLTALVHKTSALICFILIACFFSSSLLFDMFGNQESVLIVKNGIFYSIWLLIPLMAITGMTGVKMAPKVTSGPIGAKKKRMPLVALNGLLILLPAAYFLRELALNGEFNSLYYAIQTLELFAGFINLTLMSLNIRDAMALKKGSQKERKPLSS
ncbi:hypothetical protein MED121_14889 [Marinomonas sp. MED121]|uniref:hypothetical protein n=1 Tax=Marinomonas sp. MED121 TaxID=314277 RepID=UPI0000691210|nr:hypothetical protein [Marinomonas sp. MED121]EAQ67223.1 hypothetical protein MED121_14889 [Marinomonas sp. MED121]